MTDRNKLKPRRSYTTNSVPLVADLEENEMAVNWTDGKVFVRRNNAIVTLTMGGSGGGGGSGLTWSSVPASATASGTAGEIAYDGSYFYVCTASNTWVRYLSAPWFAPPQIAGLQLWLDAAQTSTLYDATSGGSLVAADGSVARWEDRSGNGNHATQATSGSRPVRRSAGLNGWPSVQFVANDADNGDWLGVASTSALNGANGLGIFCVYSTSTTGSNRALAGKWPGTGENVTPSWVFGWSGSDSATAATMFVHNGSAAQTALTTTNFNDGTPRLLGLVNTSSQLQARMNGVVQGTNNSTVAPDANSTAGVVIGGYNSYSLASGQRLMSCHISELLIYSAALTSQQVTNIESYLMTKWSIT